MKRQERIWFGHKIRCVLCSGLYLVQNGDNITLQDMNSGIHCVRVGQVSQGLFRKLVDVVSHTATGIFVSMCQERCTEQFGHENGRIVAVMFLKSGYIVEGFLRSLSDYVGKEITIESDSTIQKNCNDYWAVMSLHLEMRGRNASCLYVPWERKIRGWWWRKGLSVSVQRKQQGFQDEMKHAYLQFMDCTSLQDAADWTLRCLCMWWSTDHELDHTVRKEQGKRCTDSLEFGKWFGIKLYSTIESSLQLVTNNCEVYQFTSGLPWPQHRFYVNRFYSAPQTDYGDGFVHWIKPLIQ